jgi:iron uptake system component EfeO
VGRDRSSRFTPLAAILAAAGACCLPLLAGCSDSRSSSPGANDVAVKASDTTCLVATSAFQSGNQTFAVSNAGSQVTEVVLYGAGDRVVGEVSNIGPSSGKRLTVALKPGRYQLTCKPGLVGKGIRTPITVKAVSGSGAAPTTSPELDAAVATYRRYVVAQSVQLLARTKPFVAAVTAGDVAKARALYSAARAPYESIQPIAASSGDLGARIDARIDDVDTGKEWIGFHRLEHDLWLPVTTADSKSDTGDALIGTAGYTADISKDGPVAAALLKDVGTLVDQVQRVELSADQISTAAQSLLDELAGRGLAGQEERYSGLDLVDVAANVAGAEQAYEALRSIVIAKNPDLVAKLDLRFLTAQQNLAEYGSGSSFAVYQALSKSDLRILAASVNAVVGPMASLTAELQKSN